MSSYAHVSAHVQHVFLCICMYTYLSAYVHVHHSCMWHRLFHSRVCPQRTAAMTAQPVLSICISVYMCICMYVYMYVCIFGYMYVCTYV
jgi:hypothetical protein